MRTFLLALLGGATGALLVVVPALVLVTHRAAPGPPAPAPVGGQGPLPAGTPPAAPTTNPTVLAGYRQQQATQAGQAVATQARACQQLRARYEDKGAPYRPQATAELTIVELEQLYGLDPALHSLYANRLRDSFREAAYGCLGR